jgi:indole-3-glycerol phosphate synthase/phosphoribosylanthranilate isomerase
MLELKICGITRRNDLLLVERVGADYCGVVLEFPPSPRSVTVDQAREIFVGAKIRVVGVLVNKPLEFAERAWKQLGLYAVQLHGDESPDDVRRARARLGCEVWKVVHLPPGSEVPHDPGDLEQQINAYLRAGASTLLFDTSDIEKGQRRYGGTGKPFEWESLHTLMARLRSSTGDQPRVRVFLAGGLNIDNVRRAIEALRPDGIDVSSGVELSPGVKDPEKVIAMVEQVKGCQLP